MRINGEFMYRRVSAGSVGIELIHFTRRERAIVDGDIIDRTIEIPAIIEATNINSAAIVAYGCLGTSTTLGTVNIEYACRPRLRSYNMMPITVRRERTANIVPRVSSTPL